MAACCGGTVCAVSTPLGCAFIQARARALPHRPLPHTFTPPQPPKPGQIWLAVVFGTLACVTSLNSAGVPLLQFLVDPFLTRVTQQARGGRRPGMDCPPGGGGLHPWSQLPH
jgi:hypothetical protein